MARVQADRDGDRFSSLIKAARAGDDQALAQLVDECRQYLLLVANQDLDARLKPKLGASDIVQTAMLSAHNAFDDFEGESREAFLAWIRGILKNDLREANRRYGMQKRQVDRECELDGTGQLGAAVQDPAHTPRTNAVVNEEAAMLEQAMRQLSDEYREVIELRNWQHLSFAEIGERMNRSSDAARKLWARAIVQMQGVVQGMQNPSD